MTSSGSFLTVWFTICFEMSLNLRRCVQQEIDCILLQWFSLDSIFVIVWQSYIQNSITLCLLQLGSCSAPSSLSRLGLYFFQYPKFLLSHLSSLQVFCQLVLLVRVSSFYAVFLKHIYSLVIFLWMLIWHFIFIIMDQFLIFWPFPVE